MSLLTSEPFGTVDSMEALFAIAAAMEQVAIDGYSELAERMRREDRPDLAEVFDRLVAEESAHLAKVHHWSRAVIGKAPDDSAAGWDPGSSFDDEGAGIIAPELLSAYRAFSIAVRNEERAFAFWSYLAARSASQELRSAAEQMAREELEHVATLRRERRRAFHAQRAASASIGYDWAPNILERRFAELLEDAAKGSAAVALSSYAVEARLRADALVAAPLGDSPLLAHVSSGAVEHLLPCAELLLECYLDFAERLLSQEERDRAQSFAAQLLSYLPALQVDAVTKAG